MASVGVGLIGTGFMGKCHALAWNGVAPTFGDVERPRLVALADADGGRAQAAASTFGFARATTDWRDMLDDPEIDIVSVTTPNHLHREMVVALLGAGKHVWCEKPMATALDDAEAMLTAARTGGRLAVLGYNYIQNPAIRTIGELLAAGRLGRINHVRIEMDEDFMADPDAPFSLRDEARSGHGSLDDFGVHALSLMLALVGLPDYVMADMTRPNETRDSANGPREVETHDIATILFRLPNGASGVLALNRAAWGRKGRIAIQIFGSEGTVAYDQERLNEVQLFERTVPAREQGFRTILSGPAHHPYGHFVPAPGHGLGFNDLKVIEAREILRALAGEEARLIDFEKGIGIERAVEAMARSFRERRWVEVP